MLHSIEQAIKQLQTGGMIVVVDDEQRENEGDIIIAAQHATSEKINFLIKNARGLVCLSMLPNDFERLQIPMMTKHNRAQFQTAFGVSIEAADNVTTGISAADRAETIRVAIDDASGPSNVVMPGHIFPLKAAEGGVLLRNGHTEAGVDLARLAGLKPAAVICEIISDDGSMARLPELKVFAKLHDLPIVSIKDLQTYRLLNESLVDDVAEAKLPIDMHGEFTVHVFKSRLDGSEHVALVKPSKDPLVRLHSECLTGDVFHSRRCDCGAQLDASMQLIAEQGGVLLYLRQEGRGIGLANKIKAYALQEQGMDTVEANLALGFQADERDYGIAAQILKQLGYDNIELLTNNPAKIDALQELGICVTKRRSLQMNPHDDNIHYMQTKANKMQHWINTEMEVQ